MTSLSQPLAPRAQKLGRARFAPRGKKMGVFGHSHQRRVAAAFRHAPLWAPTMEADMCAGDDVNCPDFERHRANMREALGMERRSFLKSAFVATGGAAAIASGASTLVTPALAQA